MLALYICIISMQFGSLQFLISNPLVLTINCTMYNIVTVQFLSCRDVNLIHLSMHFLACKITFLIDFLWESNGMMQIFIASPPLILVFTVFIINKKNSKEEIIDISKIDSLYKQNTVDIFKLTFLLICQTRQHWSSWL